MTQFQLASSTGDYSPRCNADRVSPRHETGLKGSRKSWRGLSFVRGEFWLAAKNSSHARKSRDGITWQDLPPSTPGGRFAESDSGER